MSVKYGQQFINSKLSELSFLSSLAKTAPPTYNSPNWDYSAFIEFKFKLMQHLRSDYIRELTEPVTKRSASDFKWGELKYQYLYQRQGLSISLGEDLISYPIKKSTESNLEFFTTSGQSATLVAFEFIKNEFPQKNLRSLDHNPIYYESRDIIQFCQLTQNAKGTICVYDGSFSYSLNGLKELLRDAEIFIFDTTLFSYGSEELEETLEFLNSSGIPTILIRSHLKLDSLGAEFSSLGSIALINMNNISPLATARSPKVAMAKYLSMTGSYASIDQIYPFLGNSQFSELSWARCKRIQTFGKTLTQRLKALIEADGYPVKLINTWHSYYFYIKYPCSQEINMHTELEKLKIVSDLPAFYCDSFGFDFLALTCVPVLEQTTNNYMYRFSTPDMEVESIDSFLDFFAIFLKVFNEKLTKISAPGSSRSQDT